MNNHTSLSILIAAYTGATLSFGMPFDFDAPSRSAAAKPALSSFICATIVLSLLPATFKRSTSSAFKPSAQAARQKTTCVILEGVSSNSSQVGSLSSRKEHNSSNFSAVTSFLRLASRIASTNIRLTCSFPPGKNKLDIPPSSTTSLSFLPFFADINFSACI